MDTYIEDVPFAPVCPFFVKMLFHYAIADGYIDDIITVMLEIESWVDKALNAAPLVIHSLFRLIDGSDPLPRDDSIIIQKLKG